MKNHIFGLLSLTLLCSSAARAEYEIYESYIELSDQAINQSFNDQNTPYVPDSFSKDNHFFVGSTFDHIPSAYIHIKESDIKTGKTKTTRILVKVAISQSGVNMSASYTAGKLGLRFISGKKISEIVGPTYGGGSGRIAIGLNLGASYWYSGAGVLITDFESLVVGFGLKAVDTEMVLTPYSRFKDKTVRVTDEEGTETFYSFDEAKDFLIGHN